MTTTACFRRPPVPAAACTVLALLAACAATDHPKPQPAAGAPSVRVNTVARDRDTWQQLLSDHAKITRVLRHSEKDGVGIVDSLTQSDDPDTAARIIDHARAMQARMKAGAPVRVWDPVFADLFERHANVTLEVTPTDSGVRIVESSRDPETIALMRSHAVGVSAFVRAGHAVAGGETPRLKVGDPLPPDEVALAGLPHRFLLGQPTPAQLALLRAQGVGRVINFRKPAETPDADEAAAVVAAGATYCNLPYKGADELTDDLLAAARAEYAAAANDAVVLAPHCRTGNRVGPGLAAYLAIDLHVPVERAIAAAKAVGMSDPAYERITRDYIRRHASPGADRLTQ
jgi:uncharacterized protein (TIGR01244 family)